MGSWWSSGEDEMSQKLLNELKQSIKKLKSEFDRHHQTLTGQKKLNNIADQKTQVGLTKQINNIIKELQEIQTRVRSMKMEGIAKKLNGTIDTLLQDLDNYKIKVKDETKAEKIESETLTFIRQLRETDKQLTSD